MLNTDRSDPFPYAIAAGIIFVAVLDGISSRMTMPVLYTIPLLMYALSHRRRWLPLLAAAAVVLSFVVLFLKAKYAPPPSGNKMLNWRILNRSFASVAICLTATLLYIWVGFCDAVQSLVAGADESFHSADPSIFRQLLHSITAMLATIAGVVLTASILIADLLSPAPANLPILYGVPLILVSLWLQDRRVLWGMLPFLLCFTIVGYYWGVPPVHVTEFTVRGILINRALAAAALVVVALILHFRMGTRTRAANAARVGEAASFAV